VSGQSPASVSVLMPTYQAAAYLDRVLAALAKQRTNFRWDFTALDCGSTDGTLEIFARHSDDFPVPLRVLALGCETFDHGDTRNLLAASSSGDLLVYLTDDAIPVGDHWLAHVRAAFDSPAVVAAYCRNVPRADARPGARALTHHDPTYSTAWREQNVPDLRALRGLDPDGLRALFNFCDTASALRRSAWQRHPYPRGVGEDIRIVRPWIEAGYTVRYLSDAVVEHTHEWDAARVEARAAVDGELNAEFLGRRCIADDLEAAATLAALNQADRDVLTRSGLPAHELETELAWMQAQREAYIRGLARGSRAAWREAPTVLLENPRLSLLWFGAPETIARCFRCGTDQVAALAESLRTRGHNVALEPAVEPARISAARAEVVHVFIESDLDSATRSALRSAPCVVHTPRESLVFPFGAPQSGLEPASARDRVSYRGDTAAFDLERTAAIHEYRSRMVACRANGPVILDRFAGDADRRIGDVSPQGRHLALIGFEAGALEWDVVTPAIDGETWRLEVEIELLAHETDVPMGGRVFVDDHVAIVITPLCSKGLHEVVTLRAEVVSSERPRRIRVENRVRWQDVRTFAWKTHGRLRVRRVRLVRHDLNFEYTPAPPAPLATPITRVLGEPLPTALVTQGFLDDAAWASGKIRLNGWMIPRGETDDPEIRVRIDGTEVGRLARIARPDVGAALPGIAQAENAGFRGEVAVPSLDPFDWHHVALVGTARGEDVARLDILWRADFATLAPSPPAELLLRVVRGTALRSFRLDGLRTAREFLAATARRRDLSTVRRVLDFGCGCGRVLAALPHLLPHRHIAGCDIDTQAIDYCATNISGVDARTTPFDPPTHYVARTFDAIFAYSIFTHLTRDKQAAWLAEFARLLAPGGVLVFTVHGEYAARTLGNPAILTRLLGEQIIDDILDPALDGVLPVGTYRAVLQTEAFTRDLVARVPGLSLVDYYPRGASGFQDLAVVIAE
jgi:glycosyltransferase involved in cell wall biosynthesis/SAM-dependent methyltransferase